MILELQDVETMEIIKAKIIACRSPENLPKNVEGEINKLLVQKVETGGISAPDLWYFKFLTRYEEELKLEITEQRHKRISDMKGGMLRALLEKNQDKDIGNQKKETVKNKNFS